MKNRQIYLKLTILALFCSGCFLTPPLLVAPLRTAEPKSSGASGRILESYGLLPVIFEVNRGQAAEDVKFTSRGRDFDLALGPTDARLLPGPRGAHQPRAWRLRLMGADREATVSGLDPLPGKSNYFIGNDPARWRANVPQFARVRYREVYPEVDWVFYGNQQQLEYDFVVRPGGDPRSIHLGLEGAGKVTMEQNGDLFLIAESGFVIRSHAPVIYQDVHGVRQLVAGRYRLGPQNEVTFEVGAYDRSADLVIDPAISYATHLGGTGDDVGRSIAVDAGGNVYVAGATAWGNFDPSPGSHQAGYGGGPTDVFVTKLNASGSAVIYSTYLGGREFDQGNSIAIDSAGNAYVTGWTNSTDFPTKSPLRPAFVGDRSDAFVTKLNATGSALVCST